MDERSRSPDDPGAADGGRPIVRRRWEAAITREEIAELMAERRWEDLRSRLAEARTRYPKDLELLRSIRVLEDHLSARTQK